MSPSRASFSARRMAACAVGLHDMRHVGAADAHQGIVHDGQRIFGARVVAGQHHEVAGFGGRLPHQRTLGAVAVAAAAEKRDDALGVEPAGHGDDVAQRIVGMRVVHHDDEGLAFIDALEAPGHGLQIGDAARDHFGRQAVGQAGRTGGKNVIDVDLADQRRFHGKTLLAVLQVEAQPAEAGGDMARAQSGIRAQTVPEHFGFGDAL